jgi:hypothetical protein
MSNIRYIRYRTFLAEQVPLLYRIRDGTEVSFECRTYLQVVQRNKTGEGSYLQIVPYRAGVFT